jgi:hypothetical protein
MFLQEKSQHEQACHPAGEPNFDQKYVAQIQGNKSWQSSTW